MSAPELFLAGPADAPELAAISLAAFGEEGFDERVFRRYLTRAHAAILGLRRGAAIVSYTVAEFNRRQRRVYVVETCTRPDARGAGHALRLRAELERLARGLVYASITSHVRASNLAAQRLNERAGMERVGIVRAYYDDGEAAHYFRRGLLPRAVTPARTRELLEVRRSSRHGRGVFARRDLAAGTPVLTFGGRLVVAEDVADELAAMQVGSTLWLVTPDGGTTIEDFANHSCAPNVGFVDGTVTLRALRALRAGEEVCWDYSTSIRAPTWRLRCRCGAEACRGSLTGFDGLAPADRARLRPLALAYLR